MLAPDDTLEADHAHALDQAAVLAALRARVARMENGGGPRREGEIEVCAGMPGMARAAVHEVLAAEPGCGAGFAAMVLGRTEGSVLWIGSARAEWQAWPPGLAAWGLTPDRLVLLRAERWKDALWAMEEALRCPAVGGALLVPGWEDRAPLDLTATRRLQLAAEAGGGLGLVLRADGAAAQGQTAAHTRWRVAPAEGDEPHWRLELLRMRGGRPRAAVNVAWRAVTGRLEPFLTVGFNIPDDSASAHPIPEPLDGPAKAPRRVRR